MKKAKMSSSAFNRIIDATKDFCAKHNRNPAYNHIRLEFHSDSDEVVAIGVDGFRLSVEHAVATSEEDFVIYVKGNVKLPANSNALFELIDDEAFIRCNGFIFGFKQPQGEFLNWENVIPTNEVQYRIGFNGDYLLSALQAAKKSVGSSFKNAVILEFRSPTEPILLRTNKDDVKMVLPIKIKE